MLATTISFAVISAPQWVASMWSLGSSEPLLPWLLKHHIPHLAFSPWFITAPVGGLMFLTVVWIDLKVPFLSKSRQVKLQHRIRIARLEEEPESPPPPVVQPRFTGVEMVRPPRRSHGSIEKEIRDSIYRKINEFLTVGEELLGRQYLGISRDAEFQFIEWSKGCEEYLRDQLGEIVAKFFRSRAIVSNNPIGITAAIIERKFNYERDVYDRVASCVIRLREILAKIETGEINPC